MTERSNLLRRPNFFSFETPDGGVFLRCFASDCLSAEGTTREIFDAMTHAIGWPEATDAPRKSASPAIETRLRQPAGVSASVLSRANPSAILSVRPHAP